MPRKSHFLSQLHADRGPRATERYEKNWRLEDLNRAITEFQRSVAATDPREKDLDQRQWNLAHLLRARGRIQQSLEDLDEAIALIRQLVSRDETPADQRVARLRGLGALLEARYHMSQSEGDLSEAATAATHAVALADLDSIPDPWTFDTAGSIAYTCFCADEDTAQVELSASRLSRALDLAEVRNDPPTTWLPTRLRLTRTLLSRFEYIGECADLDRSILLLGDPDSTAQEPNSSLSAWRIRLAVSAFLTRYHVDYNSSDLARAVAWSNAVITSEVSAPYQIEVTTARSAALADDAIARRTIEGLRQSKSLLEVELRRENLPEKQRDALFHLIAQRILDLYRFGGETDELDRGLDLSRHTQSSNICPPPGFSPCCHSPRAHS